MGGVEFGLKQSVQEELLCKETSWAGNGQNGVVFAGDDSFVDQFLDLQNADDPQEVDFPENLQINNKASAFLPPPPLLQPIAAAEEDLCSVLTLPEEEPELEWLSHFMEDSFSPPYPADAGIPPPPPENETPASFSPAPALPRSRRSKHHRSARGPVWPISSSSATESTTSSSSSSSATSSPWPPTSPSTPLEIQTPAPNHQNKKRKNRAAPGLKPGLGPSVLPRTCSHCGSQKTPQWRAGPMGAKTLCNACGVRFKSGRLFPEYRPACSPTFSSVAHSNSHRKVLEMRKKKENMGQPEPGLKSALTRFG